MEELGSAVELLRRRVEAAEKELADLKTQLAQAEKDAQDAKRKQTSNGTWKWPLQAQEYERYGRQMILPGFGVEGQLKLKNSRVLIVGAGGLGCPAAAYLAGAGVGTLGIVDGDTVEASNLHRQIAHATSRIGATKAQSLSRYLYDLNPLVEYKLYEEHLTPQNAQDIVSQYDLVLDCTDNPATRYLISDICVLLGKPLVSASALRTDGQLIVLNCPPAPQGAKGGPCYRCVFPRPPPAASILSCGEGGVLGPAVGTMGVLQAGEAIKIIVRGHHVQGDFPSESIPPPSLLLFSTPLSGPPSLRTVRMRSRRTDCFACSASSNLTLENMSDGSVMDYVQFCGGAPSPDTTLLADERISASEYATRLAGVSKDHFLLDVREPEHFAIASLDGAVNVPFSKWEHATKVSEDGVAIRPDWFPPTLPEDAPIYVVCRVGNDSQLATRRLKDMGLDCDGKRFIGDIRGGMRAWKEEVDKTMPFT
ncbi:molybdenum cofactor synthesis protein [Coniochaeta sp. 2T2.1]|nr:molybdenum cofactor synthesis protein [Coniochaeta sp. 2T2.1]